MTEKLQKHLESYIHRVERIIAKRERVSNLYSRIRLVYFIIALLGIYFTYGTMPVWAYLLSIIGWIGGFLVLLDRHRSVYQSQEKFEHLKKIKQEHIARMNLDWDSIGYHPISYDSKQHFFANDFDLLGKHSLSHLIDTSIHQGGTRKLIELLLSTSPVKESIIYQQELIKQLAHRSGFRDKLRVIGLFTELHGSEKDWTTDEMLAWLRLPKRTELIFPLKLLWILFGVNMICATLFVIGLINPLPLLVGVIVYLTSFKFNDHKIKSLLDSAYQIEIMLNRLKGMLMHVEEYKVPGGSELADLLSVFQEEKEKPSGYIKKTQKMMTRASLKKNEVLWIVVNTILPWDYHYAWKVEELKEELEPRLSKWLNAFYDLEAFSSLSNFAILNPEYTWPEFETDSEILFESVEMGHPLIPPSTRVDNNFKVEKGKELFLITGSNMAGKSTFLRTVGINLILAYSGAPVCARSLNTDFFRVFSSINITDSLDDGLSHFYAEVKRLRDLLDQLQKENEAPLFFFVDEIYRGTNNRERFAGSAAFLKEVAGKNGIGLVSSHDLELAELDKEISQLSNWHFVEKIEQGKMSFEYKLKPGPCPSTNALHIMRIEGLPT